MTNYIPDPRDLNKIESDLNKIESSLERSMPLIMADVVFLWKAAGIKAGAVETGAFVRSIKEFQVNAREFLADTSSDPSLNYSDLVERGVHRDSGRNTPGRFPAREALDKIDAENYIERRITAELDKVLQK